MSKLRSIAVSITRGLLPKAAEELLAQERIKVCETCDEFKKLARQCRQCGCFVDLKAQILTAECPTGKW